MDGADETVGEEDVATLPGAATLDEIPAGKLAILSGLNG